MAKRTYLMDPDAPFFTCKDLKLALAQGISTNRITLDDAFDLYAEIHGAYDHVNTYDYQQGELRKFRNIEPFIVWNALLSCVNISHLETLSNALNVKPDNYVSAIRSAESIYIGYRKNTWLQDMYKAFATA